MRTIKTEPKILRRAFATIVDYMIYIILVFLLAGVSGKVQQSGMSISGEGLGALFVFFGFMAIWFIYFPFVESLNGQTLGHLIAGLKVIRTNGDAVDLIQTTKRRCFDPIDLLSCYGLIAFLLVNFSQRPQRLGDIVADTLVIGGDAAVCKNCGASLSLSPVETIKGKFTCPECEQETVVG